MKTKFSPATLLAALIAVGSFAASASNAQTHSPVEKTKPCFQCNATGEMKCPGAGCKDGQADCPAPCIKLRTGVWKKHPELNRPDPSETMQDTTVSGHRIQVSSHHEGVYYVWANGAAEMKTCPTCNGTTRVQCKTCAGKGTVKCEICEGKKIVPESWTAFDCPRMRNRPTRYKLKDGRELLGRKISAIGSSLRIRTEAGDVNLDTADIVSEEK
ncbi:MAG: hypothetical protein EPO07_15375, partial [Verrucomicrobia bacterium]